LFAVLMMFVYPIGIPCFFFVELYRHRDKINPELERLEGETDAELQKRKIEVRDANDSISHLRFLFDERGPAPGSLARRASRKIASPLPDTSRAATSTSSSTSRESWC